MTCPSWWAVLLATLPPTIAAVAALITALRTHREVKTVKDIVNGHDRDG